MNKEIYNLLRERKKLEKIFEKTSFMVAASFCKRANGSAYLATSINGVTRHKYVKKSEEKYWQSLAIEWKEYSKAIARWVVLNNKLEKYYRNLSAIRLINIPERKKRK